MRLHNLLPIVPVLACLVPVPSVAGQFVLISDERRTQAQADVTDFQDGDAESLQEFAVPFSPFDSTLQAIANYLGITATSTATQTSLIETDVMTIVGAANVTVGTPGQMDAAYGISVSALDVTFQVLEPTDILLQVDLFGSFTSLDIFGQGSMQLWREDPCPNACDTDADCFFGCFNDPNPGDGNAEGTCQADSCLVHDFFTCGTWRTLETGTYRLMVSASANAGSFSGSAPDGGSADATVAVTVSTLEASSENVQFSADPVLSELTVTVQFPNEPPQVFTLNLAGTIGGEVTDLCGVPGLMQVGNVNLGTLQESLVITVPGTGPANDLTISDIAVGLDAPSTRGTLVNNSGQVEAGVSVSGQVNGQEGFLLFNALLNCLLDLLCTSGDCDNDFMPAGPGFDTLQLPGIDFTTALDLGLGAMNPMVTVTGDLSATLVEACPWDCGDGDGNVGIVDFLALLAQWGGTGSACDLGLGTAGVGIDEFLELLANWGPCP